MSELGGADVFTIVEDVEHTDIHALTLCLHQGAPNPANLLADNNPLIPQYYNLHSHSRPFFKILVWEDELRSSWMQFIFFLMHSVDALKQILMPDICAACTHPGKACYAMAELRAGLFVLDTDGW